MAIGTIKEKKSVKMMKEGMGVVRTVGYKYAYVLQSYRLCFLCSRGKNIASTVANTCGACGTHVHSTSPEGESVVVGLALQRLRVRRQLMSWFALAAAVHVDTSSNIAS